MIAFLLCQPLTGFYLGGNRITFALILSAHPRIDGSDFRGMRLGCGLRCGGVVCYDGLQQRHTLLVRDVYEMALGCAVPGAIAVAAHAATLAGPLPPIA